jgi:hypothetical protein
VTLLVRELLALASGGADGSGSGALWHFECSGDGRHLPRHVAQDDRNDTGLSAFVPLERSLQFNTSREGIQGGSRHDESFGFELV